MFFYIYLSITVGCGYLMFMKNTEFETKYYYFLMLLYTFPPLCKRVMKEQHAEFHSTLLAYKGNRVKVVIYNPSS